MNDKELDKKQFYDFLLKEYEQAHQLAMHENQQAEQRVRFYFITISISFGAIGTLLRADILSIRDSAIGLLLLILLLFGHTVYDRIQMRDLQLRKHFLVKKKIQEYFQSYYPELNDLFAFQQNPLNRDMKRIKEDKILISHRITSSMNYIVMVVNSLLAGLVVLYSASTILSLDPYSAILCSLIFGLSYLHFIKKYSKHLKAYQAPWKYM